MARTLDGVEIHSTQTAQFHVKLFVTSDGHAEAFAGREPMEAHDKGFAWLQTLPELSVYLPADTIEAIGNLLVQGPDITTSFSNLEEGWAKADEPVVAP